MIHLFSIIFGSLRVSLACTSCTSPHWPLYVALTPPSHANPGRFGKEKSPGSWSSLQSCQKFTDLEGFQQPQAVPNAGDTSLLPRNLNGFQQPPRLMPTLPMVVGTASTGSTRAAQQIEHNDRVRSPLWAYSSHVTAWTKDDIDYIHASKGI